MAIDKYMRIKQVSEITGLSRATIYNMEKIGDFPKKTVLSTRAVAWRESEVVNWMDSRKELTKSGREAAPGDTKKSAAKKREIKKEKEQKSVLARQDNTPSDFADADNSAEIVVPKVQPEQSCEGHSSESNDDWSSDVGSVVPPAKRVNPRKGNPISSEELRSAVTKEVVIRKRSGNR